MSRRAIRSIYPRPLALAPRTTLSSRGGGAGRAAKSPRKSVNLRARPPTGLLLRDCTESPQRVFPRCVRAAADRTRLARPGRAACMPAWRNSGPAGLRGAASRFMLRAPGRCSGLRS